jgi:hypothetical protein
MVRAAIIGATGYGGVELIRLLCTHPHVQLTHLTSESYAGQRVSEVYPHLAGLDLPLPGDACRARTKPGAGPAGGGGPRNRRQPRLPPARSGRL